MDSTDTYLFIIRESSSVYGTLPPAERRRSMDRWNEWVDGIAERGKLVRGDPLEADGRIVRATQATRTLDGPFTEAKEVIAGYFLVTAASLDEAAAIARECPNLRYGMSIEVRPLARACELARTLGWETMREPGAA